MVLAIREKTPRGAISMIRSTRRMTRALALSKSSSSGLARLPAESSSGKEHRVGKLRIAIDGLRSRLK
jgi:hypothetical protein